MVTLQQLGYTTMHQLLKRVLLRMQDEVTCSISWYDPGTSYAVHVHIFQALYYSTRQNESSDDFSLRHLMHLSVLYHGSIPWILLHVDETWIKRDGLYLGSHILQPTNAFPDIASGEGKAASS